MTSVREVWSSNLNDELKRLRAFLLDGFKFLTFDTEFPGFPRNPGKKASAEKIFSDMQYNVNRTKLLQLGITISDDDGNVGGAWKFNFRDFDEWSDYHDPPWIRILKKHRINFNELRKKGIAIDDFGYRLMEVIRPHQDLSWVTFHGIYNVGYLIKLLTKTEIPESVERFGVMVGKVLGYVCDGKYMARFCEGLKKGEISLQKMAECLKVDRIRTAPCAGSDSLLIQSVFEKIIQRLNIPRKNFKGFLYGVSFRILPVLRTQSVFEMMINTFDISPEPFRGYLYALSFQIRRVHAGSYSLLTQLVFRKLINTYNIPAAIFKILPEDVDSDSLLTKSVFGLMRTTFDISQERFEGFLYGLSFQILTVDGGSGSFLTKSVLEMTMNKLHISPELFDGFLYGLNFQIVEVDVDCYDILNVTTPFFF